MKTCKDCKITKPYSEFHGNKTTRDKCASYCKECHRERNRKSSMLNREHRLKRQRANYLADHEKSKADRREHYQRNKPMYLANYYKRQHLLTCATPRWLSKEQFSEITNIYIECKNKCTTDQTYHVDHIVPLSGENVCGLHVPWNLQILTAEENLRKNNKHESDDFSPRIEETGTFP